MATKTINICDNCKKEVIHQPTNTQQHPPGWIVVYSLKCKANFSGAINTPTLGVGTEKDYNNALFCSKECVKKYVKDFFFVDVKSIIDYIDEYDESKSIYGESEEANK